MSVQTRRRRRLTPLEPLINALESASPLDQPAKAIGRGVRSLVSGSGLSGLLSGTWLGHALHPMMTDVVIGTFMSASLLDLLAPDQDGVASERLIATGLAAYLPTAAAGFNDWADTEIADDAVRRVGLAHANINALAASLYIASLTARRRGQRSKGTLLGAAGITVLMAGGYLGGHLSLNKAVGPDQTAFDPGPTDWTPAVDESQLQDGRPTRVVVDDTPVLVLREAESVFAIHDRCSHRGCSLSDGDLQGEEIVCACHGSRFDVRDGSLRGGPATVPQPVFQVRRSEDRIEIRRLAAD